MQGKPPKKVIWVRSSLNDLKAFPDMVQRHLGFALKTAQFGGKHLDAKPLRGFRGASVVEIVEDYDGDTYRAVYAVKFAEAVYVLHAFQKKAKRGSQTPKHDLDLIEERLNYVTQVLHPKAAHRGPRS